MENTKIIKPQQQPQPIPVQKPQIQPIRRSKDDR